MSILEEEKLNELKTKFATLDFQDPNFIANVQEIINDTLKNNQDKIGAIAESKTIDEALAEEKEGFAELEQLKEEGVLSELEDKDLEEALNQQAVDGIIDEEAEIESLEQEGFVKDAMRKSTPQDIIEEILKQLEEIIEEKKKAIDKKIEENEAMRKKVAKREKLRASRKKVDNLHQKTKEYKGKEGKQLNENVESAIADFDKQLERLEAETTRDGVEMTDDILNKENKELLAEKERLEKMMKGFRDFYQKDQKVNFMFIESEINKIAGEITTDMDPKELSEKVEDLWAIYDQNKDTYGEEISQMLKEKKLLLKKEKVIGKSEEIEVNLASIANTKQMYAIRANYMYLTNKEEKTKEDEQKIGELQEYYKKNKDILELVCGDNIEVLPLQTEEEYIEEFEGYQENAEEMTSFMEKRKINNIAKKMQNIYATLVPFIGEVKTKGIKTAYRNAVEALRNNKNVKESNLSESELPGEDEKRTKKPVVSKVEVDPIKDSDIEGIGEALDRYAESIINGGEEEQEEGQEPGDN